MDVSKEGLAKTWYTFVVASDGALAFSCRKRGVRSIGGRRERSGLFRDVVFGGKDLLGGDACKIVYPASGIECLN